MRRSLLSLVFCLLSALAAGPGLAEEAAGRQALEWWDAGDGTVIALAEDHRVPLVRLRLDFPAGTLSVWARERHAIEAFEIQLHDPGARLRERADRLAVDIDVGVGERSATLTLRCHRDDLEAALALVRDVLSNREFDRSELKRRSAQRKIGWRGALKDPDFVLWREMYRALFRDGDPRRFAYEEPPRLETNQERLAAARDALITLPGRIIGWSGAITRAEADERSRGLLPAVAAAAPANLAPQYRGERGKDERGAAAGTTLPRLTQVYFADARLALSLTDPDHAALMLANHVLGGHFHSRLYEALRHEGGDTYGASARYASDVVPSHYALWTFTNTQNAPTAEEKLRAALARFHSGGITEEERAAAASFLVGRRAFSRQAPSQLIDEFAWERLRGLPRGFRDDMAAKAAALPLEQVNAFVRGFYDPAYFTMVTVRPRP